MCWQFFVFLQNFFFYSDKWCNYALLLFCSFFISVQHYFPPGNIPDERLRHLPRHLLLKDYYIFTSLFFFFLWTLFRLQCKLEREQRGLKVWQDKVKSVMRIAELLFTFIPPPLSWRLQVCPFWRQSNVFPRMIDVENKKYKKMLPESVQPLNIL